MNRINKYLACIIIGAGMMMFSSIPAMAQRGGHAGGGGHVGGGGHFSGGGFSGARTSVSAPRFNSGFRSASPRFNGAVRSGFTSPRFSTGIRGNAAGRSSFGVRSGFAPGHRNAAGFSGYRSGFSGRSGFAPARSAMGYRSGQSGINGVRSYRPGYHGAGIYGHGGAWGNYSWRRHHDYFYNRGYYGSLYYPMLGLGFGDLPYGYYPFWWNDGLYYYDDGFFYQYNDDQYTVVEPPVGAEIESLPSDAQSIVINGQQFYELNGVYYEPVTKDDGSLVYEVAGKDGELNTGGNGTASVEPQVGDVVTQLPADCHRIKLNGQVFYVSVDGIYYQQVKDADGSIAYRIVALDSAGQNQ